MVAAAARECGGCGLGLAGAFGEGADLTGAGGGLHGGGGLLLLLL